MHEAGLPPLHAWDNFYIIMGSAGAGLTGLMFVVIALIADVRKPTSHRDIAAFGTPTVVHFCAVLLVAAILTAPWRALWNAAFPLGFSGFAGVAYVAVVVARARHQTHYQPVLEDWLWHWIFPFAAYTTLVVAAIALPGSPEPALFGVAAAMTLLLFIGIHNAWDTVTYIAVDPSRRENERTD